MPGKDPARSKRLTYELWSPRIHGAATPRDRVVVLVDAARAHLPDDDPMWAALDEQLGKYLKEKGFGS
ncbi:hypothetical protein P1P68_12180 [Streptomyces scabiei]|uniref:hypothetical protein n=1 Tax=Streptomyces scabiei TaxID=1930 RepID=UPI00298F6B74|nr:hypothetical protein [Streptomyces scabiei]MDW8805515.1 hypothetical protein [Streptomyces scabiei]